MRLADRPLALASADLPGCGGAWREPEDFYVEEVPAYLPSGEGEHAFLWVEKRGVATLELVKQLSRALGIPGSEVGYAGMKDKHAVTKQWLSVPAKVEDELKRLELAGVAILEVKRHANKLKTGHLRGNRFVITLRGVEEQAEARALAVIDRLNERGLPNYFGTQRFGVEGDNAQRARAVLRKEQRAPRDRRRWRLLLSALQSQLFNEWVARRIEADRWSRLLGGEVMLRAGHSNPFVCEDPATDQSRLLAREVVLAGPLYGPRMPWAAPPALADDQAVLAEAGLSIEDFAGQAG